MRVSVGDVADLPSKTGVGKTENRGLGPTLCTIMAEAAGNKSPGEIPSGYQAISALPQQQGPLRVCVLVRQNADPIAGHLILLRDSLDAKAYLGCLVDAAGKVQR